MPFVVITPTTVPMLVGLSIPQLQQYLLDAQMAMAQAAVGGKYSSVSYEGKSVSYQGMNFAWLQNWILLLQRQLEALGALTGPGYSRRAIRPYFR